MVARTRFILKAYRADAARPYDVYRDTFTGALVHGEKSQCPMDPRKFCVNQDNLSVSMVMGNRRTEKSEELRLLPPISAYQASDCPVTTYR